VNCRHCHADIDATCDVFLDLGTAPPSNAFLSASQLGAGERYLPLQVYTCPGCRLVQVGELQRPDALFGDDYVYFSSFSQSWLAHAREYVERACLRLSLGAGSFVVEIASNDGYLLQYVDARCIRCLGIEPTASTAAAARLRGVPTLEQFLGVDVAREVVAAHGAADLVVANNVLAHVPDINDFVRGVRVLLAATGTATFEFPHLLRLVADAQFDTVYHEHYSYLSLHTVRRVLAAAGLAIWDVEALPTHGGSLRVWAQRAEHDRPALDSVAAMLEVEVRAGMTGDGFYRGMQRRAEGMRNAFVRFLLDHARAGRTVVGYGAAAKGNTLLNFAGVRPDLLRWVADASPHKQGRFLPGSRIPVVHPDRIAAERPEVIVLLPWNLRDELRETLSYTRRWGAQLVTVVPTIEVA
jgi:hypothetical protein